MSTPLFEQLSDELSTLAARHAASLVSLRSGRRRGTAVVWSADGLLVTADHLLSRRHGVRITLPGGEERRAEAVHRDGSVDVAVLRVESDALTPIELGDSDAAKVGQLALVLGRPGPRVRATLGIISGVGDSWRTGVGGKVDRFVDVDASLPPGFSGGVLATSAGVVGLNTGGLVRGGTTLPASTVRRVVDAALSGRAPGRGYLGVEIQPVKLPAELEAVAGQGGGLLLTAIEAGSPADEAGLRYADTLLGIGEETTTSFGELFAALGEHAGQSAEVRYLRAGALQTARVEIGERR